MKVIVQSVEFSHVAKGKTGYDVADISYSYNGESKKTKILSFIQPSLFAKSKELKSGEAYDVQLEQDGKYMRWASWEPADGDTAPSRTAAPAAKGNWETAEERAARQVLIVKQSSLAQAVAYLKDTDGVQIQSILDTAQVFTDWVLSGLEDQQGG